MREISYRAALREAFDEENSVELLCHIKNHNKESDMIHFLCLDRTKITLLKFNQ